jgi:hypothetical protein
MRVANVKGGHLDLEEVKYITIRRAELEKLRIEPGDLLMTEGGEPDKLGRAALWKDEIKECVHQNHVFKVRADRRKVLPTYLRSLAGSSYGKAYFLRVAKKTTGIASINKLSSALFRLFCHFFLGNRTSTTTSATLNPSFSNSAAPPKPPKPPSTPCWRALSPPDGVSHSKRCRPISMVISPRGVGL